MHRFDKDGDGAVDVVEFTKAFFKLGFEERTRRTKERRTVAAVRFSVVLAERRRYKHSVLDVERFKVLFFSLRSLLKNRCSCDRPILALISGT